MSSILERQAETEIYLLQGISTASVGEIFIHWAPQNERTFLANLGTTGLPLGFIISYPVAGYLNRHFHWETTFYITGMKKYSLLTEYDGRWPQLSDICFNVLSLILLWTSQISGSISIVWSLIFFFTVADYPSQDKFMKKVERNYFKEVHKIASEEKVSRC